MLQDLLVKNKKFDNCKKKIEKDFKIRFTDYEENKTKLFDIFEIDLTTKIQNHNYFKAKFCTGSWDKEKNVYVSVVRKATEIEQKNIKEKEKFLKAESGNLVKIEGEYYVIVFDGEKIFSYRKYKKNEADENISSAINNNDDDNDPSGEDENNGNNQGGENFLGYYQEGGDDMEGAINIFNLPGGQQQVLCMVLSSIILQIEEKNMDYSNSTNIKEKLKNKINEKDIFGRSIFFTLICLGLTGVCDDCLEVGYDINEEDYLGNTALHYMFFFNQEKEISYLKSRGAKSKRNNYGFLPEELFKFEEYENIMIPKKTKKDCNTSEKGNEENFGTPSVKGNSDSDSDSSKEINNISLKKQQLYNKTKISEVEKDIKKLKEWASVLTKFDEKSKEEFKMMQKNYGCIKNIESEIPSFEKNEYYRELNSILENTYVQKNENENECLRELLSGKGKLEDITSRFKVFRIDEKKPKAIVIGKKKRQKSWKKKGIVIKNFDKTKPPNPLVSIDETGEIQVFVGKTESFENEIPFSMYQEVNIYLPESKTGVKEDGEREVLNREIMLQHLAFGYNVTTRGENKIIECPLLVDMEDAKNFGEIRQIKGLTKLKNFKDLDSGDEVQFFVYFHNCRKWIDYVGTSSNFYKFKKKLPMVKGLTKKTEMMRNMKKERKIDFSRILTSTNLDDYKNLKVFGKKKYYLRYLAEYEKRQVELRFMFCFEGGKLEDIKKNTSFYIPYHPNVIYFYHCFKVEKKDYGKYFKENGLFLDIFNNKTLVFVTDNYRETLSDYVKKKGKLEEKEILFIAKELLEVVKFLKENKIIHFSIKPETVYTETDGKSINRCILSYFRHHEKFTSENGFSVDIRSDKIFSGSPFHLSPEVNQKNNFKNYLHLEKDKVDFSKADVFQVGLLLAYCCGEDNPFFCYNTKDRTDENCIGIETSDYSKNLKIFIKKLLKCDPSERLSEIDGLKYLDVLIKNLSE